MCHGTRRGGTNTLLTSMLLGQGVVSKRIDYGLVVVHRGEISLVDGLTGIALLDDTQNTLVQMFVEVLGVAEGARTGRAPARTVVDLVIVCVEIDITRAGPANGAALGQTTDRCLLTTVGRSLLDLMYVGQVSFEDVGPVEGFLGGGTHAGTEWTKHRPLVVGQRMSVLVVLARESLLRILARGDGALLRPLRLMGECMGFEVAEDAATFWIRASTAFPAVVARLDPSRGWTVDALTRGRRQFLARGG